ncbi:MAG: ribose-phosphate pyrophosphokinase [Oligoflexia bacterium]|nr:ribose-phosphate pyrophosphokinase [Oligoflexia bacterium]
MKPSVLVFSGRSNPKLTGSICEALGQDIGRLEVIKFSDGELSIEINENVRGRDCFIVQSTNSPGNDHLMELLISIDAFKRASASRITAVLPYFGYARQDRKLKARVPITSKLIADLLTTAGADRILTMDLHSGQIVGFFNIPVDNLNALPVMLPYIREKYGSKGITIVSPDAGGVERARNFAQRLDDAPLAVIDKRRSGPNQVAEMNVVGEVKGRTCVIVDDMIDTGGTLVKAGETLLKEGAKKVIACCVHAVFSGNSEEGLTASGFEEIVVTDTIQIPRSFNCAKVTRLSVASLFAEAIRRIHSEDSISSLFK